MIKALIIHINRKNPREMQNPYVGNCMRDKIDEKKMFGYSIRYFLHH